MIVKANCGLPMGARFQDRQGLAMPFEDLQEETLLITWQLAKDVKHIASFGIVHWDLKPNNIMITKSKCGMPIVKVLDFGIAKDLVAAAAAEAATATTLLTSTQDVPNTVAVSTPATHVYATRQTPTNVLRPRPPPKMTSLLSSYPWMAPEAHDTSLHIPCFATRRDMWARGAIVFFVLVAWGPFDGILLPANVESHQAKCDVGGMVKPHLQAAFVDQEQATSAGACDHDYAPETSFKAQETDGEGMQANGASGLAVQDPEEDVAVRVANSQVAQGVSTAEGCTGAEQIRVSGAGSSARGIRRVSDCRGNPDIGALQARWREEQQQLKCRKEDAKAEVVRRILNVDYLNEWRCQPFRYLIRRA